MLTINFLQRSLFRWKFVILITLIITAMAVAISLQINRWLPAYALSFSTLIAQQFHTKISFQTVHYRFPDHIVFKNVNVLGLNGMVPMLQASRVTMGLFHTIAINDLAVNFPALKDYLARHGKKIHSWAKIFPAGKCRLLISNGRIILKDPHQDEPIAFTIDLKVDRETLSAHGYWGDKDKFNYKLNGTVLNAGFELDNLTIDNGRTSVNLWGSWFDKSIDWKGFILYNKFYILDIDGHLRIQNNDLVLKHLSFTVNGDAVTASGHCSRQDPFQCDADLAYNKNIDLHLHAQNTTQGLAFKGWVDLDRIHASFEDLKARIVNGNFLKLKIKQIQAVFSINSNEHRVSLEELWASINFSSPYQKAIAFSTARAYAGHINSRIFVNTSSFPWQIEGQGKFERIDINLLSHDFPYFQQCHGLLTGTYTLEAQSNPKLNGTFTLLNGNFDGSRFQEWMVSTLQMPSLGRVSNADIAGHFSIDGESKMLDDLTLKTGDLDLRGFFHLDEDDLVSSQASVRFSKELLKESRIGRDIMGLVHGAWTLPFEFELSGNVHRMNFQWDNSPLKDKVRQHLFSFFERMIDRRMDAHPNYNVTMPNESVSPG
jgi:hypothetical protein